MDRRFYRWIVLACLISPGSGQAFQLTATQPDRKPHPLSGVVLNSITRQPVARVLVQVGEQFAFTDREGRFAFDSVTGQGENLVLTKPGYFQSDSASHSPEDPTWQVIPEAIVYGTVRDQAGSPVQDLPVQLVMQQVYSGAEHWSQMQGTTTNSEGEFRFAELRAGKYLLNTQFFIDGLPGAVSSLAFPPSTYPPPSGESAAGALGLKAGDRMEATLNLVAEKIFPVSVRVEGSAGTQVVFEATTAGGDVLFPSARFDSGTGTYLLTLPSASYHLVARGNGREPLIGIKEITVGQAPSQGISIALAPLATLPLDVDYQAARPPSPDSPTANAQIESSQTKPRGEFTFESTGTGTNRVVSAQPLTAPGSRMPALDAPRFFQNVEPGRYELRAQIPPPWYLASATCGSIDLMRESLVLSADAGACTVRALLRDDAATLQWTVASEDGNPATLGQPFLLQMIPLDTLNQAALLSFGGSLPMNGTVELPPGRYLALALEGQQEVAYHNPEVLRGYLALGQQVTLERNGKAEVQLHLRKGDL